MATRAHPPVPGPFVQPNFLDVMEAMGPITFPISKAELLERVGDTTVIHRGTNVSLHDIIKDLHDDHFESETEFSAALEVEYPVADEESESDAGRQFLPEGEASAGTAGLLGDDGLRPSYHSPLE